MLAERAQFGLHPLRAPGGATRGFAIRCTDQERRERALPACATDLLKVRERAADTLVAT